RRRHARLRRAGHALQRRDDVRRLLAGPPSLRPHQRGRRRVPARGEPAVLVLRIGRADLRGRGLRRLAGRVVRVGSARRAGAPSLPRRPRPRADGGHAPVRARADLPALARRLGARRALVAAGAVLAAAVLAWLLPLIWLSGGLYAYVGASTQLYGSVVLPTSVLGGSLDITFAQARYLLESVIVGLGPLAFAFFALPFHVRR